MTDAGYTNGQDERMSWLRRRMAAARAMGQGAAAMARTPAFRQGVAQSGPARAAREVGATILPSLAPAAAPAAITAIGPAFADAYRQELRPTPAPTPTPSTPSTPPDPSAAAETSQSGGIDPRLAARVRVFNMARQAPGQQPAAGGPSARIAAGVRGSAAIGEIDAQIAELRRQSAFAARSGDRNAVDAIQAQIDGLQRSRALLRRGISEPIIAETTPEERAARSQALAAQVPAARLQVYLAEQQRAAEAEGRIGADMDPEVRRMLGDRAAVLQNRADEARARLDDPVTVGQQPAGVRSTPFDPAAAQSEAERFMQQARTRAEVAARMRDAEREAPALAAEGMNAAMRAQIAQAERDRAVAEREAAGVEAAEDDPQAVADRITAQRAARQAFVLGDPDRQLQLDNLAVRIAQRAGRPGDVGADQSLIAALNDAFRGLSENDAAAAREYLRGALREIRPDVLNEFDTGRNMPVSMWDVAASFGNDVFGLPAPTTQREMELVIQREQALNRLLGRG